MMRSVPIFLVAVQAGLVCSFLVSGNGSNSTIGLDIKDPKTNLDYFIRTIGSKDANISSVNYINGSIFAKQPGIMLQKLFNFEGYNINRKLLQANGSYLSLSREFVVYRHPVTHVIQKIWMNPWSHKSNEVFDVANDPVNANLQFGDIIPTKLIPGGGIVFNTDVIIEYPNALDPAIYPQYSAGPVYEAAELFGFFANLTRLMSGSEQSVPMTGTWIRRSQYLPWMEMSVANGQLYYTTFSWKCKYSGLACVADDIMTIINKYYPKYKDAPTVEEVPNETSWTVFKAAIDKRRKAGLPDIIIPTANIYPNLTMYDTFVDQQIVDFFEREKNIPVYLNGTAWSQITGKQPINLFNIEGNVLASISKTEVGFYTLSLTGSIYYLDVKTGKQLSFWYNPLTGDTNFVPNPVTFKDKIFDFPKEFVYSMEIAPSNAIGLLVAQSEPNNGLNGQDWSVNMADMIFDGSSFGGKSKVFFYGTAGRFSSWSDWMYMGNMPGDLVQKVTFYRN